MLLGVIMEVRLSSGSEAKLGLRHMRTDANTNTIYLRTRGICQADCAFCAQGRFREMSRLARIDWNVWELDRILPLLANEKRACIQCLNYPEIYEDLLEMVKKVECPVSVSAQPFSLEQMRNLKPHVDRISISLDCATPRLFYKYKPFYNWNLHWTRIRKAVEIFGKNKVVSHLIVGLGETEREMVEAMTALKNAGVVPSLFAFTPVKGTPMQEWKQPDIGTYRRLQIARHLLMKDTVSYNDITYSKDRIVSFGCDVEDVVTTDVFRTQGCPNCNRPYYNERPGSMLYNYPFKIPNREIDHLLRQAAIVY